jgi:hypothetical protein
VRFREIVAAATALVMAGAGIAGRASEYDFTVRSSTVRVHGRDGWKLVLEHVTVVPLN